MFAHHARLAGHVLVALYLALSTRVAGLHGVSKTVPSRRDCPRAAAPPTLYSRALRFRRKISSTSARGGVSCRKSLEGALDWPTDLRLSMFATAEVVESRMGRIDAPGGVGASTSFRQAPPWPALAICGWLTLLITGYRSLIPTVNRAGTWSVVSIVIQRLRRHGRRQWNRWDRPSVLVAIEQTDHAGNGGTNATCSVRATLCHRKKGLGWF